MSESVEAKKRRLEFLKNERQQKYSELQQLGELGKTQSLSAILHSLTGDGSTSLLHQQQNINRINDINSQIRRLDFEINSLEEEIGNSKERDDSLTQGYRYEWHHEEMPKEGTVRHHYCPSCRKDISEFPADIKHCPYCGSKL